jgi:hypothetical protein
MSPVTKMIFHLFKVKVVDASRTKVEVKVK